MPEMLQLCQQMQQPQQQLAQCQHDWQQQHASSRASTQQEQQQQQLVRPVLLPQPQDSHQNPSSSSTVTLDTAGLQQLRRAISNSTSLHELQLLLPDAAAADLPDITTRIMLQTVQIARSIGVVAWTEGSGSSSTECDSGSAKNNSSSSTLEHQGQQAHDGIDNSVEEEDLAVFLQQIEQRHELRQQQRRIQQQQEMQQLLRGCDALLYHQAPRLKFQHISGILWCWAQLKWRPAAAPPAVQQAVQQQTVQQQAEEPQHSLWRLVIDKLVQCDVRRELSGRSAGEGAWLGRWQLGRQACP